MIYPDTVEHKIGFDTIREQLKDLCTSAPGRLIVDEMSFDSDRSNVVRRLEESAEMVRITSGDSPLAIGNIHDLAPVLASIRLEGASISANDLVKLRATLTAMADIAVFFKNVNIRMWCSVRCR